MENIENNSCLCGTNGYIVLACSVAYDLGQITDIVARKLRDKGVRKMNCLSVVGAGKGKSIEDFKTRNILMPDGCTVDCGKRILDNAGFTDHKYFRITDPEYKKGQTPITEEIVNSAYEKAEIIY